VQHGDSHLAQDGGAVGEPLGLLFSFATFMRQFPAEQMIADEPRFDGGLIRSGTDPAPITHYTLRFRVEG